MRAIGVIPARYGSTRFPAKPLVNIAGVPLLQRVIENSLQSKKLNEIIVATDHEQIAALAQKSGAKVVMTESSLPTGSDRVWAAVKDLECDVVVNIQGDEPLISGSVIDSLVEPFLKDTKLEMATLGREIKASEVGQLSVAKIVLNHLDEALYFSRAPIPYTRVSVAGAGSLQGALKHIGLYAFRKNSLREFCAQTVTELERLEGLEQLRALYLGFRIKVIRTTSDSWGVDTPEDVETVERKLRGEL